MSSKQRKELLHSMLRGAILLTLAALFGGGLVSATYTLTAERIAANERAALMRSLNEILPAALHDNDLLQDSIEIDSPDLLGSRTPLTAYRARVNGEATALILTVVAPDGYSGPIRMLVSLLADGRITGVRIIHHKETPGLGDNIDIDKNDWIRSFNGKSLKDPSPSLWKVRKDGGVFDQFTGATITPRAVVRAVYNALRLFDENKQELLAPAKTQADADAAADPPQPPGPQPPPEHEQ